MPEMKHKLRTGSACLLSALLIFSLTGSLLAGGGDDYTAPEKRMQLYQKHLALVKKSPYTELAWQFIGPTNISGRMTDMAVATPKGKYYTIYVAGASGGVWKTINEGITWEPVFQHAISTSIGDVTLAPSDQNIVWIGTGEANIFRSSMAGGGVYKSTDAGKTWTHMGLTGTHTIPRIVIRPDNPDVVYVAASGHEWTDNPERGIYKTTDGGRTWKKVLFVNNKTGAIDLVMDPSDPNTLYAAFWQRVRERWNDPRNEEDYTGSGIYKTTDGGETWTPINEGLPPARYRGRIGIDLCRARPQVVYAYIDNYEIYKEEQAEETDSYGRPRGGMIKGATVYRSDDGGMHWRQASLTDDYMTRLSATYGWVFGQIRVDPVNPDKIYVMGLALNVSEDGGKSFRRLGGMHGDHHGLWIDPDNTDYLVNVNDGGLAISFDGGANWRTFTDNLPLAQFFNVMYDMDTPFHVLGSIQDHGSFRGTVNLDRGRDRIPAVEFESAPGGEGSNHAVDPTDPNIVYSAGFYGSISRTDLSTGQQVPFIRELQKLTPHTKLRGQWLAPFIISPHNPRIIYHGMQFLYRSLNRGDTWEKISPDLTYNDPKKTGDIPYQTIFTISESPLQFGLIYAGTDDGRIHVTPDGGRTWKEITKGLAQHRWISRVVASAFDKNTVYLAQNGKRWDDFTPYLFKSSDRGAHWQSIVNNLPSGPINVVREDPKHPEILYVGTDLGVYVTLNGGATWSALAGNFPTTFVSDIVIQPREDIMIASTHGRGLWAFDVRYIYQVLESGGNSALLFAPESVALSRYRPMPASLVYYLPAAGQASLRITDAGGKEIVTLKAESSAGYHHTSWSPNQDEAGEPLKPGDYTVTLIYGDKEISRSVKIISRRY